MGTTRVTLQKAKRANDMQALYLDFHPPVRDKVTNKLVHKLMLGVKIHKNPKNEAEIEFNKTVIEKAEAVKAQYIVKFMNEEFGFLDTDLLKGDFLAYFAETAMKKNHKWAMVYKHFYIFVDGSCTFKEITVDLCNKFKEYLLEEAVDLRLGEEKLSQNSCAGYFSTFRAMLKIAYQNRRIKENVNDYINGIKWEDPEKAYLTIEELKRLAETPCDIPVLKVASIFSCFTGLRISDVLNLSWENIVLMPDGNSHCMRIVTQKTKSRATLPISDEALQWCGERGEGLVFKGLKRTMIYAQLRKWIAEAGIDKHITFHCFRHTFAVLQLSKGASIYTVAKMMTHRHVGTTEIYAKIINETKVESANLISLK